METMHKGMGTPDIKSWLSLLECVMIDFHCQLGDNSERVFAGVSSQL